ncbi:glycosyltransferase [Flavivirga rizhaonensis]|uniref:Glycosyltransferase n=1 Tax=Flavivirga rizhaonensis TaxID=2559571 RepID=A0A4S1E382_9FLAO|nr:glycosyltransferase [Flavivirga rizhaonensis]TGV04412.1 glycosyltransferase [Flavivirga rizhaonensis]
MVKRRKRIGLLYFYDENWVAGSYYILNIIHALNTLKDALKPKIIILTYSNENFDKARNETKYPYLEFCAVPFVPHYNIFERVVNKVSRILLNKKIIKKQPKPPKLDFVYPQQIEGLPNDLKKVNWIPDFQEDHLPQFFSQEEIDKRKQHQQNVLANSDIVVFSSLDAQNDFERLYPKSKADKFVLRFAVTHPDFSNEKIEKLLDKYKLPNDYFFVPNQFWAHKNHIVILKAVNLLKQKGINLVVAFSGKESDYRNLDNFSILKQYISDNRLDNNIRFLGFLARNEQLALLKNSIAIIQPSLFEGWSTVVEDVKALNKYVILSNLNVHKEQIKENVHFFNPYDEKELAKIIEKYSKEKPGVVDSHYKNDIDKFALNFIDLIKRATKV